MSTTSLIYHEDYLKHDAGFGHPERKERLTSTMNFLKEKGILDKLKIIKPEPATEKDLLRVHTKQHVEFIKNLSESGGGYIDGDTIASSNTYEIAKLAAGGVISAGKAVMSGKSNNSFALIRPPGHHATRNRAMGFCYFNNVAVMIRFLQEKFNLKKIFLLDWDAHAANGTMDIFYDDPSVLNVSIHQDPRTFYPGTGFMDQIGRGNGEGYTINIPVPAGTGDLDYVFLLKNFVIPILENYNPELIVLSAGQDSHRNEPISGLELTEEGYGEMTRLMLDCADRFCNGRIVAELEGGYNLESLAVSNYKIISALLRTKENFQIKGEVKKSTMETLNSLEATFRKHFSS